jgi:formylglycine-generating enzyme required for sulfatase activity
MAGTAAVVMISIAAGFNTLPQRTPDPTEVIDLPAATFAYRAAGEYLRDGQPVNPPLDAIRFDRPVAIMKDHVSRADYERCVSDHACKPIQGPTPANAGDVPVVGVSWHDANAYAAWFSRKSGHHYRLPTDREWAYAAADLFHDNTVVADDGDGANPAKRWLAVYDSEAAANRQKLDSRPQPLGTYGVNKNGLADVAGNVWDWTSTCFVRHSISGATATEMTSCGVRVVEGAHRTYLSDFVRDPKGGACSVGIPPSNLGIRLVRDDHPPGFVARLAALLHRLAG